MFTAPKTKQPTGCIGRLALSHAKAKYHPSSLGCSLWGPHKYFYWVECVDKLYEYAPHLLTHLYGKFAVDLRCSLAAVYAAKGELKNHQPCKQQLNHLSLSLHCFFSISMHFIYVVASYILQICHYTDT